jgi:hypothetical protein
VGTRNQFSRYFRYPGLLAQNQAINKIYFIINTLLKWGDML